MSTGCLGVDLTATSSQVVAQGTGALLWGYYMASDTSDATIKFLDGGSSGTSKWTVVIDATTAEYDDYTFAAFTKPIAFTDGLYVEITNSPQVSVAYEPRT